MASTGGSHAESFSRNASADLRLRSVARGVAVLAASFAAANGALAQSGSAAAPYPAQKPIRFILPVAAGSTSDTIARLVARPLGERLGQQIVSENHPGAGGNVGVPIAARAAPDGYTLLLISSAQAISPSIYAKLAYDLERDFVPVARLAEGLYMLVVHPSVPARSVKELIALAKARPGQLLYGSAGVGTGTHLTGELFRSAAGVDLLHVPYRGAGPVLGELAGGQLSLGFLGLPSGLPLMQANKVRALGVTSSQRSPVVPDLPTLAQAGLPGFESTTWQGIVVPSGTPREVVARLHGASVQALQAPEVRERFAALGVEHAAATPEEFARYIRAEIVKWGKLIRAIGLPKQ